MGGVNTQVLAAVPLHKPLRAFRSEQRVSFGSPLEVLRFLLEISGPGSGVAASNRPRKKSGAVAQLGERLICIQEVAGSIPTSSTSTSQETEVRRQESELLGFGRLGSPMGL